MIRRALLLLPALVVSSAVSAEPCRPAEATAKPLAGRPTCESSERLKPYDPEGARAGRRPGSIDFGNGTEVRVGGRVQMDYETRGR